MKRVAIAVAALCALAGAIFALQGMSLLPSRLMYGKPEWIVIGAAMVAVGLAALVVLTRRRDASRNQPGGADARNR